MVPKNKNRDYEKELKWQASEEQKTRRAQRNAARRKAEREGKVHKGDGKEIDHLGMNRRGKLDNSNVKVVSKKTNRGRQPKRNGSDD